MDLPETLALPRAKQESLHLQPGRVNLVLSERVVSVSRDARSSRHETAPWRLCPGPAVGSGDPGQGLCWENAGG